ncbi:glycosyltransferase family 2 protein [Cupriavidus basilensis]|uniref:glycosyltransferase family 2 protein n=1 Tax=Cupriavidus basilensis TaxID=68895 RepID=UPI0020A6CFDA|nr:glycosyltransferase family 2 protein [Cupriavidus basilensis]MCP3018471.1 glycosyltransferase family 2 protein [Cupriavidus basilensis]
MNNKLPEAGMPASCEVAILIVTYNSAGEIGAQLDELQDGARQHGWQVIVLDNASHDGTADRVAELHPWVTLVRSEVNLGFAAGNNLAARHARADLLVLLNPDARVSPSTIARGAARMLADPGIGIAGGRLLGSDGRDQPSGRLFPSMLNDALALSGLAARFPRSRLFGRADRTWADPSLAAAVDWVPGAFAFIRHDLFVQLGGFDVRFFLYYEEVDLCRRIRALGLDVLYWPDLEVQHIGGVSARSVNRASGETFSDSGSQLTLWRVRSGLLYYRKHHGWLAAWAVNRMEAAWHALRAVRHRRSTSVERAAKHQHASHHVATLHRAWRETMGGRVSPPTPW